MLTLFLSVLPVCLSDTMIKFGGVTRNSFLEAGDQMRARNTMAGNTSHKTWMGRKGESREVSPVADYECWDVLCACISDPAVNDII